MPDTASSLLITAVVVMGTLVSALLAQRQARRSMVEELDRLDRRRVTEREEQARRSTVEAHRIGYTALNTAARRYLVALTNQLHSLRLGTGLDTVTAELHRARTAHADCYAEIQLIAPGPVLASARRVNRGLNHVYGMLMRLAQGTRHADDSIDAAQRRITALWDGALVDLRADMRLDLGLTDAPAPPA